MNKAQMSDLSLVSISLFLLALHLGDRLNKWLGEASGWTLRFMEFLLGINFDHANYWVEGKGCPADDGRYYEFGGLNAKVLASPRPSWT